MLTNDTLLYSVTPLILMFIEIPHILCVRYNLEVIRTNSLFNNKNTPLLNEFLSISLRFISAALKSDWPKTLLFVQTFYNSS